MERQNMRVGGTIKITEGTSRMNRDGDTKFRQSRSRSSGEIIFRTIYVFKC